MIWTWSSSVEGDTSLQLRFQQKARLFL